MLIRTPLDLGAVIRDRRKQLDLDQATLAKRIGASRRWVIGIERGRARAEIGLVLRTLAILGLRLDIIPDNKTLIIPTVDIDAIIESAKKRRP
jgi:transcriptional regulator with XRE-family HTH domain